MPDSLVRNNNGAKADRGTPLSLSQQAALLPERLRRTPAANLFLALEITGELDSAALDQAAVAVLTEHEILRTVFPDDRRVPYQRVAEAPETVVEDVRLDAADLDDALRSDARHRFDLVRDIPIRIRHYGLSDRGVVSITMHPVAADDRTLELVVGALFAAYEHGQAAPAAAQYRGFVAQQLKALAGKAADDPALAYWTERLAGLPERAVPIGGEAGARRSFRLVDEPFAALLAEQDATATLAALVTSALRDAGLGEDIPLGVVEPARTAPDAETTLGNFANHVVLRLEPTPPATPRERIAAAAARLAEARSHAVTRIEFLTHQLRGTGAIATGALFQALLGVRTGGPVTLAAADFRATELHRNTFGPHGVDVVIDVVIGPEATTVTVDFPAALPVDAVDEFVAHLEKRCLAWAAGHDEQATVVLFEPAAEDALLGGPGLGGPARTDAERVVVSSIRKVLELDEDDEVGREDTFFSLGGDSIAALRLVTDLVEQGYVLDVQTVFGSPAVCELATQLAAGQDTAEAAPVAVAAPMSASGLDPATLAALGKKFGAK